MQKIRSFIAVEIPSLIKHRLQQEAARLKEELPAGKVRWVMKGGMHLTLKFLGDIDSERVPAISASLDEIANRYKPLNLQIGPLGCFPHCQRPRVIWIGLEDSSGTLPNMHKEIETGMQDLGFEREKREFTPHLTLGRLNRRVDQEKLSSFTHVLNSWKIEDHAAFKVDKLILYRSDLKPDGAVYAELHRAVLKG